MCRCVVCICFDISWSCPASHNFSHRFSVQSLSLKKQTNRQGGYFASNSWCVCVCGSDEVCLCDTSCFKKQKKSTIQKKLIHQYMFSPK